MYNLKAMDLLSCFQKAPSLLSPLLSMNYSVEVCKKPFFWMYALSLATGRIQGACSSSSTTSNIIPQFLLFFTKRSSSTDTEESSSLWLINYGLFQDHTRTQYAHPHTH